MKTHPYWIFLYGTIASLTLSPQQTYAHSVTLQLIDADPKAVEISFHALLTRNPATNHLRIDVCKEPLTSTPEQCGRGGQISAVLDWKSYQDRLKLYYQQNQSTPEPSKNRETVLRWTRQQVRLGIDFGIEAQQKEEFEEILRVMVRSLNETETEQAFQERKNAFDRAVASFDAENSGLPVFRSAEPGRYHALLSPFEAYYTRELCRCESTLTEGQVPQSRCVLRKAGQILAWADAAPADCNSRYQCNHRKWFTNEYLSTEKNFQKVLADACGGYFVAGRWKRELRP